MRKKQTRKGPAFFEPCGGISDDGTHERIRTSGLPLRRDPREVADKLC